MLGLVMEYVKASIDMNKGIQAMVISIGESKEGRFDSLTLYTIIGPVEIPFSKIYRTLSRAYCLDICRSTSKYHMPTIPNALGIVLTTGHILWSWGSSQWYLEACYRGHMKELQNKIEIMKKEHLYQEAIKGRKYA